MNTSQKILLPLALFAAIGITNACAQFSGTVIGTAGSYANSVYTVDKAFDGNQATFFDAPEASGNWAGLDLGTAKVITEIRFCPRGTFASRMVGGIFQGANSPDFSAAVTLHTVASAPAEGTMTAQTVSNGTAFRYVRYLSPTNGFCNVAELAFYGTGGGSPSPTPTPTPTPTPPGNGGQLSGAPIGTAGSYGNQSNTNDKVYDGNLVTFFDAPVASDAWAGLDLGTARVITEVRYCPRSTFASRMVGGVFQGANSADFNGAVTLYTIGSVPAEGTMTAQGISNGTAFRYVRYLSPVNGWCNVAEVAFYGPGGTPTPTPTPPLAPPVAPTGLAATAGNAQVSLSWNASAGATSYTVKVGLSSGGPYVAQATVSQTAYSDTNLTNGTAYYYVVAASNSAGTSGNSNQANATPFAAGGSAAFANPSFETPSTGSFAYNPSGANWVFTNNAGIQRNGSAFSGTLAVAPDGVQTAFLQSNGTPGAMTQNVNFAAGTYGISFLAARRWGTVQPILVTVDGVAVGTYTPASGNFEPINTASFTVTAGNHTVALAATDGVGDKTSFIDQMSIVGGGGGGSAPAAPAGLTATAGNTQINLNWTASPGATSYSVYRGTTSNGQNATPIASGIAATSYVNTGLTNGTAYYYRVRAVNAAGPSGNSNEAFATPSSGGSGDIDLTGYTLTFSDEFDTFSGTLSSPKGGAKWYAQPLNSYGYFSASTWDIATFSASGGVLSSKAYKDASNNWRSGILYSVDPTGAGFSQQYGYFEIRCRMPNSGTGAWPAFWLETLSAIPGNSNLEIDIFEWYGVCNTPGSFQAVMQQATHNWMQNGSQDETAPHLYSPGTPMPGGAYPWQNYHIYGCKIDPSHITWYIDGVQTNQIATPTAYMSGPFFIIIDYALGGGWPLTGMVNNSSFDIDWVRVYSLPGQ